MASQARAAAAGQPGPPQQQHQPQQQQSNNNNNIIITSSQGVAIQTASLNDQSMMTYMPEQQQNSNDDGDGWDYLMEDETQFKASLDALLNINDEESNTSATQQQNTTTTTQQLAPQPPATDYGRSANMIHTHHHHAKQQQQPQQQQQQRGIGMPATASALTQRLAGIMAPQQQQQQQQSVAAPSYVSGSSSSSSSVLPQNRPVLPQKRPAPMSYYKQHNPAVSENEEDLKKRKRNDRNVREQQRSHRITQQISHLRQVLENANVQFKPDKYSTLVCVGEYIKQLQQRSALLDSEHQTLLDTIQKTGKMVMDTHVIPNSSGGSSTEAAAAAGGGGQPTIVTSSVQPTTTEEQPAEENDELFCFVQGLDYKAIFEKCGMALAVASIDGRFMDANLEFERLSGFSRSELLPNTTTVANTIVSQDEKDATKTTHVWPPRNLSLFNLFSRSDMEQLFMAMSDMLKRPFSKEDVKKQFEDDFWSGSVRQSRKKTDLDEEQELQMNITLVRSPHGRPKFFCCALTLKIDDMEVSDFASSNMSMFPQEPISAP